MGIMPIRIYSRLNHLAETTPKKPRADGVKPIRTRRYLTPDEVGKLVDAASRTAFPERNRLLLLMMYRHGLRVSEATGLHWLDIDLKRRTLHVHRLKGGKDAVHTLQRDEIEALERLQGDSAFVFVSRRGGGLSADMVQKLLRQAGEMARLPMRVFPHMLRHACGHALADRGLDTRRIQDFLGHQDIRHTVRYTELAPGRLADILL
jgi:integrase